MKRLISLNLVLVMLLSMLVFPAGAERQDAGMPTAETMEETLPTPQNPVWGEGESMVMSWDDMTADTANLQKYGINIYFNSVDDPETAYYVSMMFGFRDDFLEGAYPELHIDILQEWVANGWVESSGYYYFDVYAISSDKSVVQNSELSEKSAGKYVEVEEVVIEVPPVPENLRWDGLYMKWDNMTQAAECQSGWYVEVFYREEDSDEARRVINYFFRPEDVPEQGVELDNGQLYEIYCEEDSKITDLTGYYSFCVIAQGKYGYGTISDLSDEIKYTITVPERLDTPTGLAWHGTSPYWHGMNELAENCWTYHVVYYFSATEANAADIGELLRVGDHLAGPSYDYTLANDMLCNGTGYYYFTVTACASGDGWFDSETALSPAYHYIQPDPLPAPEGLTWAENEMQWENVKLGDAEGGIYEIELYKMDSESDNVIDQGQSYCGWTRITSDTQGVSSTQLTRLMDFDNQPGWYRFRVRAISDDVIKALDSEWSELSPAHYYEPMPKLATPSGLKWEDGSMVWDDMNVENPDISRYHVSIYYSATENGRKNQAGFVSFQPGSGVCVPPASAMENGKGYYWFVVSATSRRWDEVLGSDDSDYSPAFFYDPDSLPKLELPDEFIWVDGALTWTAVPEGSPDALMGYDVGVYCSDYILDEPAVEDMLPYHSGTQWLLSEKQGIDTVSVTPVTWTAGFYYVGINAISSNIAQYSPSGEYIYPVPLTVILGAPTDAAFGHRGAVMKWSGTADFDPAAKGFDVEVYYAPSPVEDFVAQAQLADSFSLAPGADEPRLSSKATAFGDGYYYFRVRTASHYAGLESEWCRCEIPYEYESPDRSLDEPRGLEWQGSTAAWNAKRDELLAGFEVVFYKVVGEGYEKVAAVTVGTDVSSLSAYSIFMENGEGQYIFSVQALSSDSTRVAASEAVSCADSYDYAKAGKAFEDPTGLKWDGRTMCWDQADIETNYEVRIYKTDAHTGERTLAEILYVSNTDPLPVLSARTMEENGDGRYSFSVRAVSHNESITASSNEVFCREYYFLEKLVTSSSYNGYLQWDRDYEENSTIYVNEEGVISWKLTNIRPVGLRVDIYRGSRLGESELVSTRYFEVGPEQTSAYMSSSQFLEDVPKDERPGTYFFTVKAIGTYAGHVLAGFSSYSWSMERTFYASSHDKAEDLGDLRGGGHGHHHVGECLRESGVKGDLHNNDEEITEVVRELEEELGADVSTNVSDDAKELFGEGSCILGAGLNGDKNNGEKVEWQLDVKDEVHTVPEEYRENSVCISMKLNVTDKDGNRRELEEYSPMQVTLPVPAGMDPEKLTIFHIYEDGNMEKIKPHVFRQDGKWFACFAVDSFSDFVINTGEMMAYEADETAIFVNPAYLLADAGSFDRVICAVYSGERMLAAAPAEGTEDWLEIACDGSIATEIRIFTFSGADYFSAGKAVKIEISAAE